MVTCFLQDWHWPIVPWSFRETLISDWQPGQRKLKGTSPPSQVAPESTP
jgi:hypothetical protein